MITDEEWEAWRDSNNAKRVSLVECDYSGGTEYIGTAAYVSLPTDTAPNRIYRSVLIDKLKVETRIDGGFTLGSIGISNTGDLDSWINRAWRGHEIRVKLGDASWSLDDFRVVSIAENGGIQTTERGKFFFDVEDNRRIFDRDIQDNLLANGSPIPLPFGDPGNVTPAVIATGAARIYQASENAITLATIRDNGSPVTASSTDYPNGKFSRTVSAIGSITADIQSANGTAAEIAAWVASKLGLTLDTATTSILPTYQLGLFYDTQTTYATLLDDVARSIGGYWGRGQLGELQMFQLLVPAATPDFVIRKDDIVSGSVRRISRKDPYKRVELNYGRNFTVQNADSLGGGLSDANRLLYSTEWQKVTTSNDVTDDYPAAEKKTYDTYLTNRANAQTESDRLAAFFNVPRETWQMECFVSQVEAVSGQTAEVQFDKQGFTPRINARILSGQKSFTRRRIMVEFMI